MEYYSILTHTSYIYITSYSTVEAVNRDDDILNVKNEQENYYTMLAISYIL